MGKTMLRLVSSAICFIIAVSAQATTVYQTPMHRADWVPADSRVHCTLSHYVESFGIATFYRDAGGELALSVSTEHPPREPQVAILASTPSAWGHASKYALVDDVEFFPEQTALTIDVQIAHRLLLELEKGKVPSFQYMDWQDGQDEVVVRLSNVNFLKAYRQFNACIVSLLDFTFPDVENTVVYFENDKSELTEGAQHRLQRLATYLQAAPETVDRILINGHTDSNNTDEYNIALSEQRVDAVNNCLLKLGVDTTQFTFEWHGEAEPVATNMSADGRAQNRRVEIELIPTRLHAMR